MKTNIQIFKLLVINHLRKVVLVVERGNYNIYTLLDKIFELIISGSFPFQRWLAAFLHVRLINRENLFKYRMLIIIELEGNLLHEFLDVHFKCELQCRLHYDRDSNIENLREQFLSQIESDFNKKVNHNYNGDNNYNLQSIIVKIIFEKRPDNY